jgi:transposase
MREMPMKREGEILGERYQRLWRMLFAHVVAGFAQLSLEDVVWVDADEMNRRRGHNCLTVFADLVQKRVIFARPGKDSGTWERFAAEILRHNGHPKAVTQVAIDMSAAYAKGLRENFGNARIVYDKFHVVQNVVEACDNVRKTESRLNPESQERLGRTRWLWRKNPENWTAKEAQRWEDMAKERGATRLAYEMHLVLQDIYRSSGAREASQKFEDWCSWVHAMREECGALLEQMVAVAHMIENHIEGILAHGTQGPTIAFMKGLNSLFSAVKRKARGYRSAEYMITMLYFVAGKLHLPCH